MPEIRYELFSKRPIIVATQRAARPTDFAKAPPPEPPRDPNPFAPGNEHMTPPELARIDGSADDWLVRVFNNKFPALTEAQTDCDQHPLYTTQAGTGIHEVIVDTPAPLAQIYDLDPSHAQQLFSMFQQRMQHAQAQGSAHVSIIKNVGKRAGASLAHPHTQLLGHPFVSKRMLEIMSVAREHFDTSQRSIFADLLQTELSDQTRVIKETAHSAAFCPYASRYAWNIWIIPKVSTASFINASEEQLGDISTQVQHCTRALHNVLGPAPYNMIIHSAPAADHADPALSWFVEIIPVTNEMGGFERGADSDIVTVAPERTAELLRGSG